MHKFDVVISEVTPYGRVESARTFNVNILHIIFNSPRFGLYSAGPIVVGGEKG